MSTERYTLLNGGGVMKQKRWFGFVWRDYENFDNAINKLEHQLNEKWAEMNELKHKRDQLLKDKKNIQESIKKAKGKKQGVGEPFAGKPFSGFRKPDVDKAPDDWKQAFKGKNKGKSSKVTYGLPGTAEVGKVVEHVIPQAEANRINRQLHGNNNRQGKKGGGAQNH